MENTTIRNLNENQADYAGGEAIWLRPVRWDHTFCQETMRKGRIEADYQSYLRSQVANDWADLPQEGRPKTFWIAEHRPVSDANGPLGTPIVACWYFDGREFIEKPHSDFAAFMNLAAGPSSGVGGFEIGYGGFAPILDSGEVALYWQFGGLLGVGYRCSGSAGHYAREEVWRS